MTPARALWYFKLGDHRTPSLCQGAHSLAVVYRKRLQFPAGTVDAAYVTERKSLALWDLTFSKVNFDFMLCLVWNMPQRWMDVLYFQMCVYSLKYLCVTRSHVRWIKEKDCIIFGMDEEKKGHDPLSLVLPCLILGSLCILQHRNTSKCTCLPDFAFPSFYQHLYCGRSEWMPPLRLLCLSNWMTLRRLFHIYHGHIKNIWNAEG